jgi:hypothetical protein
LDSSVFFLFFFRPSSGYSLGMTGDASASGSVDVHGGHGGGGENEKGGVSRLLKDLITGLPPVTDLAKAASVQLPPVLGRVESPFVEAQSESKPAPEAKKT